MPIITPQPIPELLPRTQYHYGELRQLFQNIGARVVKRAIQSDNYVAGISGLRINFENGTAEFATLVSGSFIKTFAQDGIPTSVNIGDIWIDTDNNNKLYRAEMVGADQIAAGEWVEVAAGVTWDELINKPAGIFQILYQATAPATGMSAGDYWIDSDDNKIYLYNGASWLEVQDDQIAQAISAAADAQSTADGEIGAFAQAAIPTSTDVGDLWIDTDDRNKLYRAASIGANEITAGEWVLMQDAGIASAIAAAATAQSTADGKII